MQQPIRVFIALEHQLFADAMTAWLYRQNAVAFAGGAADLTGWVATDDVIPFDVALIDASMVRANALQMIWEIKQSFPAVQVVVLGIEPREEDVLRFIEAGASGYLHKDANDAELLHTIKAVHHGQTLCSPRVAAMVFERIAILAQAQRPFRRLPRPRLTRREHQVLRLIACGQRNSEIAEQLGIALETVKRHVSNIFEKLQVSSRREAGQLAYACGLLGTPKDEQLCLVGPT